MERINVTLPEDLMAALKQAAKDEGRAVSNYIQRVLTLHLTARVVDYPKRLAD